MIMVIMICISMTTMAIIGMAIVMARIGDASRTPAYMALGAESRHLCAVNGMRAI